MGRRYTPLSISSDRLKIALAKLEHKTKVIMLLTDDLEDERRSIGTLIKQSRGECALSRQQLADNAGVSERFVQYIEKGERAPSAYVLHRIVKALMSGERSAP